jgi:uncharacterized membrane protein (DUF485 family)
MIFDGLKRNPLIQRELFYQRQQKPPVLFFALFYILPTALALISLGLYIWLANDAPLLVRTLFGGVSFGFSVSVVIAHFGLMLRTLYVASSAVARDKHQGQRWEMLVLTGIDAHAIVFGKWWAVVQTLWREYLILGLLRTLGVVVWATTTYFARPMLPLPPLVLWAGAAILTMTFANLCFTAACGVLTSMQIKQSVVPVGFIVRAGVCLLFVGSFLLFLYIFDWDTIGLEMYTQLYTSVMRDIPSLLSNGTTLARTLMTNTDGSLAILPAKLWGIGIPLLVYGVMTWFVLRVTQWRAEHFGALRVKEVKGKRL